MKVSRPHSSFQIIAHRGLSQEFPENTKSALIAALQKPIDMLEIDVHRTKDGELVIIHDETIDRTSNFKGAIKDIDLQTLKTYDFGSWKIKGHYEQILTLSEVLEMAKHDTKNLLIELKKPELYPGIEAELLAEIQKSSFMKSSIIIQSFNQDSVKRLRELDSELKLGVLLSKRKYWFKAPPFHEIAQYAQYLNPNYKMVTSEFMVKAHAEHLKVLPYTVNDDKSLKQVLNAGVDGVISDVPHVLFEL
ncbi:glycerophosphodiester phosphodiesterase [Staphylococcus canis]|uniref:Glycerophosphodiester phosphodiesterase n=1 Tax=Staphylococcus canis TaxID=2724942 RepID=A0ABS0T6E4_9STAP|nr:glycerophosphodiester phosphodiesterase family protein [Staphylococcus canis]MBI5974247.1 glycerophosphodiester phosphodiesterase [Staphylococcus canis]